MYSIVFLLSMYISSASEHKGNNSKFEEISYHGSRAMVKSFS